MACIKRATDTFETVNISLLDSYELFMIVFPYITTVYIFFYMTRQNIFFSD